MIAGSQLWVYFHPYSCRCVVQLVAVSYIAQLYEHFYCLYGAAVHPLACGQLGAEWRRGPTSAPAGPLPLVLSVDLPF